ncbi:MAG: DUF3667 domain-containing protein [Bacteroidota bacterium]
MSHHLRAEKTCLNCNAEVHGRYCHVCGQENVEPRESAWHMVKHFFEDITHFDGKFFSSMKYLLLKPGYLAREYMHGKRTSYLHPIRMYLFTSAIFFIIVSSGLKPHGHESPTVRYARDTIEQNYHDDGLMMYSISLPATNEHVSGFHFPHQYAVNGAHAYDSLEHAAPPGERDGPVKRYFARRTAAAAKAYHADPNDFYERLSERFIHSFSKIFFLSLPLFALLLQLLYIRRKEYYFVAHAVFSLHYYCVVFIFAMFWYLSVHFLDTEHNEILWTIAATVTGATVAGIYLYLLVAMHRFYKRPWYKTGFKFIVQSVFFTVIIIALTIILYLNSMLSLAEA